MAKKQTPKLQNTSTTDTRIPIKGMTKDLNTALVGKENYTHAINAINNSKDGDVGTLGNEPANIICSGAPYTIIGTIHLYGDKWVIYSTNNTQSEIGTWDDSQCLYETVYNDQQCGGDCLNFNTSNLITGAAKENFDCTWQVYWDDGINPSRTLNLDDIPYIQNVISPPGAECIEYETTECVDCEKLRLAPLVDIPCVKLSRSNDGGQLRNGSYQAFISYVINDQKIGDYYGMSNIQPLFDHEDLLSGLEIEISGLDKNFEFFQLVILSHNQGEIQAKEMGIYSTEQSHISIDFINQALKAVPLNTIPLSTPVFDRSDKMYVVNDYLIRQGPTEKYDFNYQPIANRIHAHWTVTKFPSDYYKKGGNKPTFMRDEVYAFFIRFVYNTGDKSRSYHIPGRPLSWNGWRDPFGNILDELDNLPGDSNDLTAQASLNGLCDTQGSDRVFEIYNTASNQAQQFGTDPMGLVEGDKITDDCGEVIAEGHMAYWQSTEKYPQDPVRYNTNDGDDRFDLCGKYIRHHKMPDETFEASGAGGFLDRASDNGHSINVLGVKFENIKMPRFSESEGELCTPDEGRPTGPIIPGIVGYEILVGSREGNKSIIAKGISRNMRKYDIPDNAQGRADSTVDAGFIPNYPFNSAQTEVFLTSNSGFSFNYNDPKNVDMYPEDLAGTSDTIFTFHSPETSFNKPFLSPFEIKTYGMTTGKSIGRFRPSEEHPRHKLLRNLSMWVGIMVGIGYAIGEMRGKKMQKQVKPKGLSIGYTSNERDGGRKANPVGLPWAFGGALGADVGGSTPPPGIYEGTLTTAQLTNTNSVYTVNTQQEGNEGVAPYNTVNIAGVEQSVTGFPLGNQPPKALNVNARFMEPTILPTAINYQNESSIGLFGEPARGALYSGTTILGGPKLWQQFPGGGYDATSYASFGEMTNEAAKTNRGYIGAGEEVTYQGGRFTEAPSITQALFGIFNFMQLTSEGGQHIIDMIYELVSFQDYAYKYSGHGLYLNTNAPRGGDVFRMLVDKARYVGPSIQNLTAQIRINNLQRPSTVAISSIAPPGGLGFRLPSGAEDNSRFKIGTFSGHFNPSQWRVADIAAHYTALKVAFKNQYGQLDQIKQIPVGCINYFTQEYIEKDEETGEFKFDLSTTDVGDAEFQTRIVYGGDCYINRYTEKVIMPFFWDFLSGQPDGFAFDYRLRSNVPRPLHWMNTAKYDLSELVRYITSFGFITGANDGMTAITPNNLHFLDRPNDDAANDTVSGTGGSVAGSVISDSGGPDATLDDSTVQIDADGITSDKKTRGLFHVKNGYMYTHCNGTQDFFVESTLNMGLRDYEDVDEKRHYDFADYTDLEAMYHSSIIRKDNFYKYDYSLSKSRFNTQLISFGQIQDRDYDPLIADTCFTHYPKRLIYSLQAQKEAKKDFWRVFLPMNYKDFKNIVNVIKPMSKSGAFVTFPNLAPALFQGVDQLKTDLGTKLTIGDGGLFSQPMQNIVNADEAHEYGSCESSRSVINTPSGLYYISQAQGKIFNYGGKGLENIANNGMKQWFNKYLPSRLLSQYPELEDCPNLYDNPVAGIGCQSVYDPNYDLVYFCKKDYEALNPDCIDFDACNGFVYNLTQCNGTPPVPCCPSGYTYNPSNPVGQECEKIEIFDASVRIEPGYNPIDIAIVLDMSGSNTGTQGHVTGDAFTTQFVQQIDTLLNGSLTNNPTAQNSVQVGLGTWTADPFTATCGNCSGAPGSRGTVIPMTTDSTALNALTTGNPGGTAFGGQPVGGGDEYDDAIIQGMAILDNFGGSSLGDRSGQAGYRRIMIVLTDATTTGACTGANCFGCTTNIQNDVWNQGVETFIVQCTAANVANIANAPQGIVGCMVQNMNNAFSAGPTQGAQVADIIAAEFIFDIPVYFCDPATVLNPCNPGLTQLPGTTGNSVNDYECRCEVYEPVTFFDATVPIELSDENYFKDVSWTVSYDPKARAWISFHDWHPDLTIPSLNHFFTTKNITLDTPYCPPGYTYNPLTDQCDPPGCPPGSTPQIVNGVEQCCSISFIAPTISNENGTVISFGSPQFANPGFNLQEGDNYGWSQTPSPWNNGYLCVNQSDLVGGVMSPDTCPTNLPPVNSIQPYEGDAFIGMLQFGDPNALCNGLGGFDSQGANPTYYQEGVWQQLVNGNGSPNSLAPNTQLVGSVALAQASSHPSTASFTNFAPTLEIWGGSEPPGLQGQNYRGSQFSYDGADTLGSSELLWRSPDVTNIDEWVVYDYEFTPTQSWEYIFFKIQMVRQLAGSEYGSPANDTNISKYLCVDGLTIPVSEQSTRSCECPDGTDMVFNDPANNYPPATEAQCIKEDDNPANYLDPETFDITCMYTECTPLLTAVPAQNELGAIWKHNARCDLFANYYNIDYPWEVELIESVGQVVNTVRSIEYQLESYMYRGNLENDCGDRFHDLDYNFDEAILHNTEQVSGLLSLNLSPKNNAPLITQFPVVTPNDIQILYSKEEQKYRFNMFWDVTADRGEFNPNTSEPIFITQLNGYIRDLNQANINLAKPLFQRKKFRHYWNAVILRKRVSGNRKMLLKLNNSKLNVSFR